MTAMHFLSGYAVTAMSYSFRKYGLTPIALDLSAFPALGFFIRKTGLAVDLRLTEDFSPCGSSEYGDDFREKIHPKRQDTILHDLDLEKPYFQVFSGKYGFIRNLSIMDLLFNEGPDSILWLKNI